MVSGVDVVASMGDGILALENDRVGISRPGLAARLAPPNSARGGKETPGNFQNGTFDSTFEILGPFWGFQSFQSARPSTWDQGVGSVHFKLIPWC